MNNNEIIQIDSRSHLEVADPKHRYAKNLRLYFKEYYRQHGSKDITHMENSSQHKWAKYEPFFRWLDFSSTIPELKECPRSTLDSDKVLYFNSDEERKCYEITITPDGRWLQSLTNSPITTGVKGWIFVLFNDRFYACEKRTHSFPRLHHSSFFAGEAVHAAGMIVCEEGRLITLFPHSGHYRPHDRHLCNLLEFLIRNGVQLQYVQVDAQRVFKASRQTEKDGAKMRKTECAMLENGDKVYHFLRAKKKFIEGGVLQQIEETYREKHVLSDDTEDGSTYPQQRAISVSSDTVVDAVLQSPVCAVWKEPSRSISHGEGRAGGRMHQPVTPGSVTSPDSVPSSSGASSSPFREGYSLQNNYNFLGTPSPMKSQLSGLLRAQPTVSDDRSHAQVRTSRCEVRLDAPHVLKGSFERKVLIASAIAAVDDCGQFNGPTDAPSKGLLRTYSGGSLGSPTSCSSPDRHWSRFSHSMIDRETGETVVRGYDLDPVYQNNHESRHERVSTSAEERAQLLHRLLTPNWCNGYTGAGRLTSNEVDFQESMVDEDYRWTEGEEWPREKGRQADSYSDTLFPEATFKATSREGQLDRDLRMLLAESPLIPPVLEQSYTSGYQETSAGEEKTTRFPVPTVANSGAVEVNKFLLQKKIDGMSHEGKSLFPSLEDRESPDTAEGTPDTNITEVRQLHDLSQAVETRQGESYNSQHTVLSSSISSVDSAFSEAAGRAFQRHSRGKTVVDGLEGKMSRRKGERDSESSTEIECDGFSSCGTLTEHIGDSGVFDLQEDLLDKTMSMDSRLRSISEVKQDLEGRQHSGVKDDWVLEDLTDPLEDFKEESEIYLDSSVVVKESSVDGRLGSRSLDCRSGRSNL